MTTKQIYLAIKHDRHTDDEFKAFTYAGGAMAQCSKWRNSDRFEAMDFSQKKNMGCHFYADPDNEDYSVRVEIIDLVE